MRVMRVFGAIFQAIGYQAKQWEEALPLNNNKASLQSLYDDLCEMEDYYYNLLSLMTDLDSKYVNSSYSLMRMDAFNMISDAKTAVWRKLHKDDETNWAMVGGVESDKAVSLEAEEDPLRLSKEFYE